MSSRSASVAGAGVTRAAALIALTACVLGPVSASHAGTFQVRACGSAGGTNASWTLSVDSPGHYEASPIAGLYPLCDASRGLWAEDSLAGPGGAPAGSEVRYTFTAEPGTRVSALTYNRYWYKLADPSAAWAPGFLRTAESTPSSPLEGMCSYDPFAADDCSVSGSASPDFAATKRLDFGLRCGVSGPCVRGANNTHFAVAELRSAIVTVTDADPPMAGPLSGSAFDEPYPQGAVTVTALGADASGIASAHVLIDGARVGAAAVGTCTTIVGIPSAYTTPKPCTDRAGSDPITAVLDLSHIPDGAHTVAMLFADPAGNTTATASRAITVDHTSPAAPMSTKIEPASPAEDTWRTTSPSALTVTAPAGQVAPIAALWVEACRAGGSCQIRRFTGTTIDAPQLDALLQQGDGIYTLSVSLEDAAGNGKGFDPDLASTQTLRVDAIAPARPAGLVATGVESGPVAPDDLGLSWTAVSDGGSPADRAHVRVCRVGGSCTTALVQADGGLAPGSLAGLLVDGDGAYTVAVSLVDQVGHNAVTFDPATASTITVDVVRRPLAIPGSTLGPDLPGAWLPVQHPKPMLRLRTATYHQSDATLMITGKGTAGAYVRASARLVIHPRHGKSMTIARPLAITTAADGRFKARLRLRSIARTLRGVLRATIALTFDGVTTTRLPVLLLRGQTAH